MPVHTAKVTSKGQITIPAGMREKLGLRPGSKVLFEEQPNGNFMVRKKTGNISDLDGFLKAPPGLAPTLEELDLGIAEAVAERLARAR